jgi:hypothetical protein
VCKSADCVASPPKRGQPNAHARAIRQKPSGSLVSTCESDLENKGHARNTRRAAENAYTRQWAAQAFVNYTSSETRASERAPHANRNLAGGRQCARVRVYLISSGRALFVLRFIKTIIISRVCCSVDFAHLLSPQSTALYLNNNSALLLFRQQRLASNWLEWAHSSYSAFKLILPLVCVCSLGPR